MKRVAGKAGKAAAANSVPKNGWVNRLIGRSTGRDIPGSTQKALEKAEDYEFNFAPSDIPLEEFGLRKRRDETKSYDDEYYKHRTVVPTAGFHNLYLQPDSFIAPSATISGAVDIGVFSSVWYGAVIHSHNTSVSIGNHTSIQDGTIITDSFYELNEDHNGSVVVGAMVTVGHNSVLHACTVEDGCVVGNGSQLCEGAYMEQFSVLAAGSTLEPYQRIPAKQIWGGSPAKFIRNRTDEEVTDQNWDTDAYVELAEDHFTEVLYLPYSTAYIDAEKQGIKVGYDKTHVDILQTY